MNEREILEKIEDLRDKTQREMEQLERRIQRDENLIREKFENFKAIALASVASINARLNALETEVNALEVVTTALEDRCAAIEARL